MPGAHRADHRADRAERTERAEVPSARANVVVPDADSMRLLGTRLAVLLRPGDLLVLAGDLGAGKTTLTQGIGTGLGVRDTVSSPTFVIARVHPSLVGGPALVHVDAYRLSGLAEIDDLDLDASLDASITVVEWGQGLVEDLAPNRLEVLLRRPHGDAEGGADLAPAEGDEPRAVAIIGYGPRWDGVSLPTSVS